MAFSTMFISSHNLTTLYPAVQVAFSEMSPMMGTIGKVTHSVKLCWHADESDSTTATLEGNQVTFYPEFFCDTETAEHTFPSLRPYIEADHPTFQKDIGSKITAFFVEKAKACYAKVNVTLSNASQSLSKLFVINKDSHEAHYTDLDK